MEIDSIVVSYGVNEQSQLRLAGEIKPIGKI